MPRVSFACPPLPVLLLLLFTVTVTVLLLFIVTVTVTSCRDRQYKQQPSRHSAPVVGVEWWEILKSGLFEAGVIAAGVSEAGLSNEVLPKEAEIFDGASGSFYL
ncbi:hypothetical protein BDF14DRAFT_1742263 [Spinellus fusiger]|nr:hypothetical protein BDF14DRAFT_1742263 [Spinellus fusiger]